MKYMLMGCEDAAAWQRLAPGERARLGALHRRAGQELVAQRGLAGGDGLTMISADLDATASITTLRVESDAPRAREVAPGEALALTSIDVIDFASREDAAAFARRAFDLDGHTTDIRPVREMWFTYHGGGRGDSPKFAILFLNDERRIAEMPQAEIDRTVKRHEEVGWQYSAEKGLMKAETFAFAGVRLLPSADGLRHRVDRGRHILSDGPFAETKELVGGFQIFDCESREQAVEWAKRLAVRDGDAMEIRPVESLWWIYHG
jgi:hypothetical protein